MQRCASLMRLVDKRVRRMYACKQLISVVHSQVSVSVLVLSAYYASYRGVFEVTHVLARAC